MRAPRSAGVRPVLVKLRAVDDKDAADLMTDFCRARSSETCSHRAVALGCVRRQMIWDFERKIALEGSAPWVEAMRRVAG